MEVQDQDHSEERSAGASSPFSDSPDISLLKSPQILPLSTSRQHGKSLTKKSFVWKYFHHPLDDLGNYDFKKTVCSICKAVLAFNNSGTTTTMLNHLKSRHGDVAKTEEDHKKIGRSSSVTNVEPIKDKMKIENSSKQLKETLRESSKSKESKGSRGMDVGSQEFDKMTLQAALAAQNAAMPPFLNPFLNPNVSESCFPFAAALAGLPSSFLPESSPFYQFNNIKMRQAAALNYQQSLDDAQDLSGMSLAKKAKRKNRLPLKHFGKDGIQIGNENVGQNDLPIKPKNEDLMKLLVEFLAKDLVEIDTIYKPGFQSILALIAPHQILPTKTEFIETILHSLCTHRLAELKATVRELQTCACLTLETWQSGVEDWATITVSYQDPKTLKLVAKPLLSTKLNSPIDMAITLIDCVADCFDLSCSTTVTVVTNADLEPQLSAVRENPDISYAGKVVDRIRVVPCFLGALDKALSLAGKEAPAADLNCNVTEGAVCRDEILHVTGLKDLYTKLTDDASFNTISAIFPLLTKIKQILEPLPGDPIALIKSSILTSLHKSYLADDSLCRFIQIATYVNPQFKSCLSSSEEEEVHAVIFSEIREKHSSDVSVNRRKRNSIVAQQSAEVLKINVTEELESFEERCSSNLSLEARDFRTWWNPCVSLLPNLHQIARRYLAVPCLSSHSSNFFTKCELENRLSALPTEEKASLLVLHLDY